MTQPRKGLARADVVGCCKPQPEESSMHKKPALRKAKYALHPGPVASRTDGDIHHISERQLAALYGLRQDEYVTVPHNADSELIEAVERLGLIHLHPRYDGDYTLPA